MSGRVYLSWTSRTKQGLMCLAQGRNAVTPVRLARTRNPSTSRQAHYHWAPSLVAIFAIGTQWFFNILVIRMPPIKFQLNLTNCSCDWRIPKSCHLVYWKCTISWEDFQDVYSGVLFLYWNRWILVARQKATELECSVARDFWRFQDGWHGHFRYPKVQFQVWPNTVNVLKILTPHTSQKGLDKQCRPKLDCFWRSSLIKVFHVCYPDKHFVNSSSDNHHFSWEQKENSICTIWKTSFSTRTQYTWTGNCHIGKCIYWEYVVEAELSKLTYVED